MWLCDHIISIMVGVHYLCYGMCGGCRQSDDVGSVPAGGRCVSLWKISSTGGNSSYQFNYYFGITGILMELYSSTESSAACFACLYLAGSLSLLLVTCSPGFSTLCHPGGEGVITVCSVWTACLMLACSLTTLKHSHTHTQLSHNTPILTDWHTVLA